MRYTRKLLFVGSFLLTQVLGGNAQNQVNGEDDLVLTNGDSGGCIRPEDCCQFPFQSKEFKICCAHKGLDCCPYSCDHVHFHENWPYFIKRECEGAWECCRYPFFAREFHWCCAANGCCPICEGSPPQGCCYNGNNYEWGDVVERLPELCINIVCAAKGSSTPPHITAALVPVYLPPDQCEGIPCVNCQNYCVDDGVLRVEGSTWMQDQCHRCRCEGGEITCSRIDVVCSLPPPSSLNCKPVPGPCCTTYDCQPEKPDCSAVLCQGPPAPNCEAIIPPGQCCAVDFICPDCSTVFCAGPPSPGCSPIHIPGECCPRDWDCPDCSTVLCAAPPSPDCTPILNPGECCPRDWDCPGCSTVLCAGPPSPGCTPTFIPGECCPDWDCPDCSVVCAGPPSPGCTPIQIPGECCPRDWDCSPRLCPGVCAGPPSVDCTPIRFPGDCCPRDWKCPDLFCDESVCGRPPLPNCVPVTVPGECCPRDWICPDCSTVDCAPPPSNNCIPAIVPGECCPQQWKCHCVVNGITITEECTRTSPPHLNCILNVPKGKCCPEWECGIDCRLVRCAGPPFPSCTRLPLPPLACCPEWDCSEHCKRVRCPGPLNPSCKPLPKTRSECCHRYECSECVDEFGNRYEQNEVRYSGPCVFHVCTADGDITRNEVKCTQTDPPHPRCYLEVPEGECCPVWKCGRYVP